MKVSMSYSLAGFNKLKRETFSKESWVSNKWPYQFKKLNRKFLNTRPVVISYVCEVHLRTQQNPLDLPKKPLRITWLNMNIMIKQYVFNYNTKVNIEYSVRKM